MPEPSMPPRGRLSRRGQKRGRAKKGMADVANVIVIGASAGGHRALTEVIKNLPADLPAAIVILLHMQLGSPYRLKETLARYSRLPIIEVEGEAPLREGAMYIPLGGRSATFGDGTLSVGGDIPTRPLSTINHVFKSAAQTYGEHVIGVILSGLLRDGTDGLRAVHDAGGLTVVQDPSEAEYADMPANAMQTLPVTFCLNLADIGPALELLVRRTARFETGLAVAVRTLRDRAALLVRLGEQSWRNAGTRDFLRQELASLRRDIQSIDELVAASSLKG